MKNSASRKIVLLSASTVCALGMAPYTFAVEWHFDPRVAVTGIYDDNRFLDTNPARENAVSGAQLDAGASIAAVLPRDVFRFVPHVWTHRYPGDSEFDETNGELGFYYDHKGQTSKAYLRSNYSRNSLLRTLLPSAELGSGLGLGPVLGEGTSNTTSRFSLDAEQTYLYAVPGIEWTLNARNRLELSGEYQARDYSGAVTRDYIDNTAQGATAAWSYDWSPRTALSLGGSFNHFTPDVGVDTNVYGVRANWARRVTEISRYYFRVGVSRAESGSGLAERSDNSILAGAGVNWAFQVTGVFLDLTRNVVPSTQGSAINQDEVRFRIQRQFKPRVSGFVSAIGVKDGNIYADTGFVSRKYAQGQAGFEWRVGRTYTLVGSYTYTWEEYDDGNGSAASNGVSLSIVYEPHRPEWISGVFR